MGIAVKPDHHICPHADAGNEYRYENTNKYLVGKIIAFGLENFNKDFHQINLSICHNYSAQQPGPPAFLLQISPGSPIKSFGDDDSYT